MTVPPVLVMIAGPNGSGKTTLTKQFRDEGVDLGVYINPDDIALTLDGSYAARVAQAQRLAESQRQDCLDTRKSFSFETVMSHPSKIEVLKKSRALGYFNILYFVATESPDFNIDHVRQRVAMGGHDVPEDRIVARYARALALLPDAIRQCDYIVLFDSTYRDAPGKPVVMMPFCEIRRHEEIDEDSGSAFEIVFDEMPDWAAKALSPLFLEGAVARSR